MARPSVTTSPHSTAVFPTSALLLAGAGIARHSMARAYSLRSMRGTSRPRPPAREGYCRLHPIWRGFQVRLISVCFYRRLEIDGVADIPFAPHLGGSWLTGSLYMNDLPTIKDLVYGNGDNKDGWQLHLPLASPDSENIFSTENQYWYGSILWSVFAKAG